MYKFFLNNNVAATFKKGYSLEHKVPPLRFDKILTCSNRVTINCAACLLPLPAPHKGIDQTNRTVILSEGKIRVRK